MTTAENISTGSHFHTLRQTTVVRCFTIRNNRRIARFIYSSVDQSTISSFLVPAASTEMRPLLLAAVVLLLIAVGTHNCDDSADETCAQSSACRCLTGHGAGIDLQPLSSVKFLATPLINSLTYYFHPCHDVDMQVVDAGNKTWTCESSSLCMFNHTGNNTFTSLGKTANSEFHDSPTHDRFIVVKLPGPEP